MTGDPGQPRTEAVSWSGPGPREAVPGDELPEFRRITDFDNWNRYAAVNDEFVPLHMDDAAGRAAGFPGAVGMGNLLWAYLHIMVREWLVDGRIEAARIQFRAPNVRRSAVVIHGRVAATSEHAGRRTLDLELSVEDESGRVLCPAAMTVSVRNAEK